MPNLTVVKSLPDSYFQSCLSSDENKNFNFRARKASGKPAVSMVPQNQALIGLVPLGAAVLVNDTTSKVTKLNNLLGLGDPIVNAPLGLTSIFFTLMGPLTFSEGWKESKVAQKLKDAGGVTFSHAKCLLGIAQTALGVVSLPARVLAIAAYFTASKAVLLAAEVFGAAGGAVGGAVAAVTLIAASLRLHQGRLVRQKLLFDKPEKALRGLQQELRIRPEELKAIEKRVKANPKYLSASRVAIKDKIASLCARLAQKKQEPLKRGGLGAPLLAEIAKASPKDAKAVIDKARFQNLEHIALATALVVVCVCAIAASVLGVVFTGGGALAIVAAVLAVAAAAGLLVVDGYTLYDRFQKSESGRYDRLWILFSTFVCLVVLATSVLLPGGWAVWLAIGLIGLVWLLINLTCLYRIHQKEKKRRSDISRKDLLHN